MSRQPCVLACCLLAAATTASTSWAKTCNIKTFPLNFGPYDISTPAHLDAAGSIQIKCRDNVPYSLYIDAGTGSSFFPRKMRHVAAGDELSYNLFLDAARMRVWGDGSSGTEFLTGAGSKHPKWVQHTVHGRVFAQQYAVSAGLYSDTVIATIVW